MGVSGCRGVGCVGFGGVGVIWGCGGVERNELNMDRFAQPSARCEVGWVGGTVACGVGVQVCAANSRKACASALVKSHSSPSATMSWLFRAGAHGFEFHSDQGSPTSHYSCALPP